MANLQSEHLKSLSETEFVRRYLVRLYEKMGFRDVEFYHGGTQELGKDLTMWAFDLSEERRNYVAVVKKGDLRGAVSGSNSAGEVASQVRQCFNTGFKDKLSNAQREVHFCCVVASGSISKETRQSLESHLKEFWKYVTCYGGDDILRLLQKNGIGIGIAAQLGDLAASFEQTIKDSEISFTLNEGKPRICVAPKQGAAPFKVGLNIKIDQSDEGQLLRSQLKQFSDQGGAVKIPGSFFEFTKVPDILKELGFDPGSVQELRIEQIPLEIGSWSVVRNTEDHQRVALEDVTLEIKGGREKIEIATKSGSTAFEFLTTVCRDPLSADFSFTPSIQGRNVKEIHEVLKFELTLHRPGNLAIVNRRTDLTLFSGRTEALEVPQFVSDWEKLFGCLAEIQRKTGTELTYSREISEDEFPVVQLVYAAVTEGSYEGGKFSFPTANLSPEIRAFIGSTVDLRFEENGSTIRRILDKDFDLGPAEIVVTNCKLSLGQGGASGELLIVEPEPGTILVNFPKWRQKLFGV